VRAAKEWDNTSKKVENAQLAKAKKLPKNQWTCKFQSLLVFLLDRLSSYKEKETKS
jgi:hypothetical protein